MVSVGGEPSGRVRVLATKQIQTAETVTAGQPSELQFKLPGTSPLDIEATITAPSGKSELCEIRDTADHIYNMKFAPLENGVNVISVKEKGLHIPGKILDTFPLLSILKQTIASWKYEVVWTFYQIVDSTFADFASNIVVKPDWQNI